MKKKYYPKEAIKANTKYPVIDGKKECGACHKILDVNDFSQQSGIRNGKNYNYGPRSDCKKCKSESSYRCEMEKKIKHYPGIYTDCKNEECNWIFKKKLKNCPRCGQLKQE